MNSTRQWFAVDKEGLAKVVRRRGVAFVLYELLQNAWDTRTASVRVSVRPVANGRVRLCVEDQDPESLADHHQRESDSDEHGQGTRVERCPGFLDRAGEALS